MRRAGLGALFERFARLKARLEAEGLFAPERKRALPRFPARIGVITSPAGAALRDVLTTLRRRMPAIPVLLYPTPVQGEGAAAQIAAILGLAGERGECDVLILCRGGGSIEDLWSFNEEVVARAIADCPIPVVSGVGHETDFTIADFVADARAPTPTGAAALASPDRSELAGQLRALSSHLQRSVHRTLERRMQQSDLLARRLVHPGERIARRLAQLAHLHSRLAAAWARSQERAKVGTRACSPPAGALRAPMRLHSWKSRRACACVCGGLWHRAWSGGPRVWSGWRRISSISTRARFWSAATPSSPTRTGASCAAAGSSRWETTCTSASRMARRRHA